MTPSEIQADSKMLIGILFKEYDTLRQEIISRTNNRFAIAGFLGAVVAFVGTQSHLGVLFRSAVALAALVILLTLWWWIGYLIHNCSLRVAEVEQKINQLAGNDLLEWESDDRHRPLGMWLLSYPKKRKEPTAED